MNNLRFDAGPREEEEPGLGLSERDADVIRAIEDEGLSVFTFDGIRRLTGTHPETLSRALERLEESGMLVKSPDGYEMTVKARGALGVRPTYEGGKRIPILHTFLPFGASAGEVAAALKGRWFDRMRWVGISEAEDGVVMKWVTDDGSAVIDAKLGGGLLDIEARVKDEADVGKAVRAAHQLIGRVSRLYSSPRPGARASLVKIGYFHPYAM